MVPSKPNYHYYDSSPENGYFPRHCRPADTIQFGHSKKQIRPNEGQNLLGLLLPLNKGLSKGCTLPVVGLVQLLSPLKKGLSKGDFHLLGNKLSCALNQMNLPSDVCLNILDVVCVPVAPMDRPQELKRLLQIATLPVIRTLYKTAEESKPGLGLKIIDNIIDTLLLDNDSQCFLKDAPVTPNQIAQNVNNLLNGSSSVSGQVVLDAARKHLQHTEPLKQQKLKPSPPIKLALGPVSLENTNVDPLIHVQSRRDWLRLWLLLTLDPKQTAQGAFYEGVWIASNNAPSVGTGR